MRRPSLRNPFRRRARDDAPTEPVPAPGAAKAEGEKAAGAAKPEGAGATPAPSPPTDPHERIDGIRAWLAQVDRKVGIRTYALGAAVVLALAAGIVGVILAVSAKDESATKDELRSVREQLTAVEREATSAAEEQVSALSDRVETLEEQVSGLSGDQTRFERELRVVQDDIEDLRTSIRRGGGRGGGGGGGGGLPGLSP